jgi:hypothetical protein
MKVAIVGPGSAGCRRHALRRDHRVVLTAPWAAT